MKHVITLLIVGFVACVPSVADAQGRLGIGFVVGEPTGFSWKYKLSTTNAFDGAIGFSPFDRFRVNVDYLWISRPFDEQHLVLHYGLGGAVGFGRTEYVTIKRGNDYVVRHRELGIGMRGIIGLDYEIPRSPVELFFEFGPLLIFAPDAGVGVDVGLGVRFYP